MAINITNLVSAINAKSATIGTGVDSALDKAVLLASDVKNALIYSSVDNLPDPSTSSSGEIVRVGLQTDANTEYYVSFRDKWKQIGVSDSDVVTANQFVPFQGTNFGYTSGGDPTGTIDKFSFTTDGNATDVGDLSVARAMIGTGQSSTVSGYSSGGFWASNVIDKFPFASDANATDVGDITVGRGGSAGQSAGTVGYGYITGGMWIPPGNSYNIIEKFSFSADGNSTDVGDLTLGRNRLAGQSSNVSGYSSGGLSPNTMIVTAQNTIDKFPFASDANATDVGDLSPARGFSAGQSSQENGYSSAGTIQKFPFASDTNATITGNLTIDYGYTPAGQSSTNNGYVSGSPGAQINKFSFASDGNASNIGSLTVGRDGVAGQQF